VEYPQEIIDLFLAEHGSYALENTQTGQMVRGSTWTVTEILDVFLTEFGSYALDNGGFPAALRAL
jgi:hypothetical protein